MKRFHAVLALAALFITGCKSTPAPIIPDQPHLIPQVRVIDETFHSVFLSRDMHLRLIVPATPTPHVRPSVVFFLHGAGTDFHDWTNNSDVASLAAKNIVLVLPDAPDSYYIDEASNAHHRYELYLSNEVAMQVYRLYPYAARDRAHVAIIGISRGGYGATILGLKHPDVYGFIGDVSGALDFPERHFRWQAPINSLGLLKIFGPMGSATRINNDPFRLIHSVPAGQMPYIYISCGAKDPLFATNKRFAATLASLHIEHEFHQLPGGHNWDTWGAQLPMLESSLLAYFNATPSRTY